MITRLNERQAQEKIDANVPDYSLEFHSSVTTARHFFSKGMDIPKTGVLCLSKTESDLAGESVYFFCRLAGTEAALATPPPEAQTRAMWKGELRRRTKAGSAWVARDFALYPGELRYYKDATHKNSFELRGRSQVLVESIVDGQQGHFVVIKLNNNKVDNEKTLLS